MLAFFLAASTLLSTFAGGLFALKNKDRLHRILGYTAGVLLGVVAFEVLPEIFHVVEEGEISAVAPMVALVVGFLTFHIVEKSILIHHAQEDEYEDHKHPHVGMASAGALIGHSFLDGVGIGLAFQVDASIGIIVAIAVLAHDFSDGINTVSLMLLNKNSKKRALAFLALDGIAPILGVLATTLITVSEGALVLYLGFFAGFLLYIGASQILPEAHSKHPSYGTIALTILGVVCMYFVSVVAGHGH